MIKVIVFDIGGTLMEYKDMPLSWLDFYKNAFRYVDNRLKLGLSEKDIKKSFEVFKQFNPRLHYREIDYSPEVIFTKATEHWNTDKDYALEDVISLFYKSMGLKGYIYPETVPFLDKLKNEGYTITALTDVAIGMPDELHKSFFPELIEYFDMYVSSLSCGYRKPSPEGIKRIAEYFNVAYDEMIIIGDEEKDIKTAIRSGIKSVYIDRKFDKADYGQDFTINILNELFDILKGL